MAKENDYLLNTLANPTFNPADFNTVGLNATNTSLETEDTYKNLKGILNNPIFLTNGEFDEDKFHKAYLNILSSYNLFTNDLMNLDVASSAKFFRNNIYAPVELRAQGPEFGLKKIANPMRQKTGVSGLNIIEAPEHSAREIAETQKVLLNPNEVREGKQAKWGLSPNDSSFFDNLFNTRVLATWDYDADENGKETSDPSKIVYHKGDRKLNLNGTYYYENLDGRSIYGKDVLSKWDTLTVDGTPANKYDFFDSDDIDKSVAGSLARAAVKLVPAFISGVAPWYIGARVVLQASDLFAKLGNMTTGAVGIDKIPLFNEIEGFNKSIGFSSSDSAQGFSDKNTNFKVDAHPWGMENMLTMTADVFTLLAELRWLFKNGTALFKGKLPNEAEQKEFVEKNAKIFEDEILKSKEGKALSNRMNRIMTDNEIDSINEIKRISTLKAQDLLKEKIDDYNKFGEEMSRLYMTGITIADSYGEAVQEGIPGWQAALFTLGYGYGEYSILKTDLGKMILPELKMEQAEARLALAKVGELAESKGSKESIATKIFNFGKQLAHGKIALKGNTLKELSTTTEKVAIGTPSVAGLTISSAISNALGEGTEEVSEEGLLDLCKGIYDALSWISGSDRRLKTNWLDENGNFSFTNGLNDYALNFVGGFLGGGLGLALPEFRQAMKLKDTFNDTTKTNEENKQAAYEYIVDLVRSGKKNELKKTVNSMTWGNKYLSATKIKEDDAGHLNYDVGTAEDNQDKAIKDHFNAMLDEIDNILKVNGADISDSSFLKTYTEAVQGIKFDALATSATAAAFVSDYNHDLANLALKQIEYNNLLDQKGDKEASEDLQKSLSEKKKEIRELLDKIKSYKTKEAIAQFRDMALFEASPSINAPFMEVSALTYAESLEKKKWIDIAPSLLAKYTEEFNKWMTSPGRKDKVRMAYNVFKYFQDKYNPILKKHAKTRLDDDTNIVHRLGRLFSTDMFINIQDAANNEEHAITDNIQGFYSGNNQYGTRDDAFLTVLKQLKDPNLGAYEASINAYLGLSEKVTEEDLNRIDRPDYVEHDGKDPKQDLIDLKLTSILLLEDKQKLILSYLKSAKYIDSDVKSYINNKIHSLLLSTEEDSDELELLGNFETEINKILSNKSSSPAMEVMDLFMSETGTGITMTLIMDSLQTNFETLAYNKTLDLFGYNPSIGKSIELAQNILTLTKSLLDASRTDNVHYSDPFGYNLSINELNGNKDLSTIDSKTADVMLLDLVHISSQLEMYKALNAHNTGQKITELHRLHAKYASLKYKKLRQIISIIKDDDDYPFEGKQKLFGILESLETLQNLTEDGADFNLSLEQRKKLEKERIAMHDAIYDFFNTGNNLDHLDEFLQLIPPSSPDKADGKGVFSSYLGRENDTSELMFDISSSGLDNRVFIFELAADTALRASDFYFKYKDLLSNAKYSPFALLERAIFNSISYILDKKGVFDKFKNALNKATIAELKTKNEEFIAKLINLGESVDKENLDTINSSYGIYFKTWLNEGIAGAGKSTAVDSYIYLYLKAYHPDVVKNVWVIHNTKENAENFAKTIGIESYKAFSDEEILKTLMPDWNESWKLDPARIVKKDGLDLYNTDIVSDIEKPSLIFIDEISGLSQPDLLAIEKLGVKIIASGDFDLSGTNAEFATEELKKNNKATRLTIGSKNFMHSGKLNSCIRTNNLYKDLNSTHLRSNLPKLIHGHPDFKDAPGPTDYEDMRGLLKHFIYYEGKEGIFGDKFVDISSEDTWKEDIKIMLDTLKSGEKLNYIYHKPGSKIYKYLESLLADATYKDKINLKQLSAAQGNEGLYYIIELDNDIKLDKDNGNRTSYYKDLYTGITRSKLGSLVITKEKGTLGGVISVKEDRKLELPSNIELSPEQITRTAQERKELLEAEGVLNPSKEAEKEKEEAEKSKESPETSKEETNTSEINSEETQLPSQENPFHTVTINDGGTVIQDSEKEAIEQQNNDRILGELLVDNSDEDKFNLLCHTYITLLTGLETDDTGMYYVVKDKALFEARIDMFNGLLNLKYGKILINDEDGRLYIISRDHTKVYITKAQVDKIIGEIKYIACYNKDKESIINGLKPYLNLQNPSDKVQVLFAYKSDCETDLETASKNKLLRFFHSTMEKLFGIVATGSKTENIHNKNIVMIVSVNDKNVLEVPIITLTSPLSIIHSQGFEEVKDIFYKQKTDNKHPLTLLKTVNAINALEASGHHVKNGKKFILLASIFLNNYDNIIYLQDDWVPAKNLRNTGILATTTMKGSTLKTYEEEGWEYEGEWKSIAEMRQAQPYRKFSDKVYSLNLDLVNKKTGKVIIKKNSHFILVADTFKNLNSDSALIDKLIELCESEDTTPIVTPIYVSPPGVSVELWFAILNHKYDISEPETEVNPDEEQNTETTKKEHTLKGTARIGNDVTAYRIFDIITSDDRYKKYIDSIDSNFRNTKSDITYIRQQCELLKDKSPSEIVAILRETRIPFRGMSKVKLSTAIELLLQQIVLSEDDTTLKYPDKNATEFDGIVKERINTIQEILSNPDGKTANKKIDKIFYYVPHILDLDYKGFRPMNTTNNYGINNLSFMVNGKIDSCAFIGDWTDVLNTITNTMGLVKGTPGKTGLHNTYNISPELQSKLKAARESYINDINTESEDILPSKNNAIEFIKNNSKIAIPEFIRTILLNDPNISSLQTADENSIKKYLQNFATLKNWIYCVHNDGRIFILCARNVGDTKNITVNFDNKGENIIITNIDGSTSYLPADSINTNIEHCIAASNNHLEAIDLSPAPLLEVQENMQSTEIESNINEMRKDPTKTYEIISKNFLNLQLAVEFENLLFGEKSEITKNQFDSYEYELLCKYIYETLFNAADDIGLTIDACYGLILKNEYVSEMIKFAQKTQPEVQLENKEEVTSCAVSANNVFKDVNNVGQNGAKKIWD